MPYICLAQNNIPDGTLQVLDLWPNTSQRNQSIDPPGQTRYVNRVQNEAVAIGTVAGVSTNGPRARNGLSAYLADRVAPGGTQAASETARMAAVVAGDIITLGGVPFTAVAVPANPALQQFEDTATAGSNILCAAALALAMNNAATDALLIASAVGGSSVTVVNGGTDTVTITADTVGPVGAMPLIEDTAGVRIVLGDATGHLDRAYEEWTTAHIAAASAAIIARVDAGQTLTEANINTAINGVVGVTGVDIVHASSSSTVLEILSILSGRRYQIARDVQFASAEGRWESAAVPVGAFTENVSVFDSQMLSGEIVPMNPYTKFPNNSHARSQVNNVNGGTVVARERGNVRYTVPGGSAAASVANGEISRMQDASVTLFPDNDYSVFHGANAVFQQPGPQTAEVANARLVTTYNDDGTLL